MVIICSKEKEIHARGDNWELNSYGGHKRVNMQYLSNYFQCSVWLVAMSTKNQ